MRNKMSTHRRTETKQSSFQQYSPSTQRQTKLGENWLVVSFSDLSFEGENQIDVFPREKRSLPSAPEEFDRRRGKRRKHFYFLLDLRTRLFLKKRGRSC